MQPTSNTQKTLGQATAEFTTITGITVILTKELQREEILLSGCVNWGPNGM